MPAKLGSGLASKSGLDGKKEMAAGQKRYKRHTSPTRLNSFAQKRRKQMGQPDKEREKETITTKIKQID